MAERYPILYDLDRWRRYRTLLLLPATVCSMVALFLTVLYPGRQASATANAAVVAVSLYALATSFWLRQRLSYVELVGERLGVHVLGGRQMLDVTAIRRVRVARLIAQLDRADRRRYLPRPLRRWETTDALIIELRPEEDGTRFRRILGRRCVFGDELIVPLDGASQLRSAVDGLLRRHDAAPASPGRRNKRRRKR